MSCHTGTSLQSSSAFSCHACWLVVTHLLTPGALPLLFAPTHRLQLPSCAPFHQHNAHKHVHLLVLLYVWSCICCCP
jgi:hypothetical protein